MIDVLGDCAWVGKQVMPLTYEFPGFIDFTKALTVSH
jgi:hypothetical protein